MLVRLFIYQTIVDSVGYAGPREDVDEYATHLFRILSLLVIISDKTTT